ncbi:MarR family transcriptional regulator [Paenibacillus sp. IB182496]|uniref:MarR family transcriptional regulator n=2 Tax=Paenibacillus sabuli TaxID=2772509 RepID=A0A927BQX4_9BACL|nr:MarR family transcriptional regulator [Paenibacillus sabuli]
MEDDGAIRQVELELAILLRRVTAMTTRRLGTLDRAAYLLLHRIDAHGPEGVKRLAQAFGLDVSTVSRQAAALEASGLVRRIPDPDDGRAYGLGITDHGLAELQATRRARQARIAELLEGWTDEERTMFGELLHKFNQRAQQR